MSASPSIKKATIDFVLEWSKWVRNKVFRVFAENAKLDFALRGKNVDHIYGNTSDDTSLIFSA